VVRQQTAHGLRLHHSIVRNTGVRLSAKRLHEFTKDARQGRRPEADQGLAVTSRLAVLAWRRQQIHTLEPAVMQRLQHAPAYEQLLTVEGIGAIVAQPMVLETGPMGRFPTVGHSAS
jgi:transposase